MTKTEIISGQILKLVDQGVDIKKAFNTVFGENAFENLASELYDQLNG